MNPFRTPGLILALAGAAFAGPSRAGTLQETIRLAAPEILPAQPLYEGTIPNSKPAPDAEVRTENSYGASYTAVSRPTYTVYLPGRASSTGAAIIVFPGGGYHGLSFGMEGTLVAQELIEHGIAAILVKYRMPNPATMVDPAIGPLQDAQRAIQLVRLHAPEWRIDAHKVGVMGFSAGGHLAATAGTHFHRAVIDNPNAVNLRPDFLVLVYPVVTMESPVTHRGSRDNLLGKNPSPELIRQFSADEQVTPDMPPALILAASDDSLVPVENSLLLYQAMHRAAVPVALHLFSQGQHGFFLVPRDEWQADVWNWLRTSRLIP